MQLTHQIKYLEHWKTTIQQPYMNTSDLLNRIDELEIRTQFQEETIDALNQALTIQQQDILLMKEQIKLLAKQIENQRQQQGINETIERPPHY